ncbi:MAG: SH3 domain-containing protein [Spirochaetota bacterium]
MIVWKSLLRLPVFGFLFSLASCPFIIEPKSLPINSTVYVNEPNGLYLRKGPGVTFARILTLKHSSLVKITGVSLQKVELRGANDYWYEVEDEKKHKGWVFGHFLVSTKSRLTVTWSENMGVMPREEARQICQAMDMRLPNRKEFLKLYRSGKTKKWERHDWHWLTDSMDVHRGYIFHAGLGHVDFEYTTVGFQVRCVY